MYQPTDDQMNRLIRDICIRHEDRGFNKSGNELSLDELTDTELNDLLRLSTGYFDYDPHALDMWDVFSKLQIWLKTGEEVDKEILAEVMKDTTYKLFEDQMQNLINKHFNDHMESIENERLYEAGYKSKTDQETGELVWSKR